MGCVSSRRCLIRLLSHFFTYGKASMFLSGSTSQMVVCVAFSSPLLPPSADIVCKSKFKSHGNGKIRKHATFLGQIYSRSLSKQKKQKSLIHNGYQGFQSEGMFSIKDPCLYCPGQNSSQRFRPPIFPPHQNLNPANSNTELAITFYLQPWNVFLPRHRDPKKVRYGRAVSQWIRLAKVFESRCLEISIYVYSTEFPEKVGKDICWQLAMQYKGILELSLPPSCSLSLSGGFPGHICFSERHPSCHIIS